MSPEVRSRIEASLARQALIQTFDGKLLDLAEGACTLAAPITSAVLQQHGAAHAGLTFALGDSAAGYAALSIMAPGREVMTAEMKINLLAPALGDRLVAMGRVLKPGRRLVIVAADVFSEGPETGRHVATLLGTMVPVDPA
ncbi:MAG: PaaI family thioesterase [Pseudomonadota bacterium]